MIKAILVVICTAASYAILQKFEKSKQQDKKSRATLIFFLLLIFVATFYWFDILGSDSSGSKHGGRSFDMEKRLVSSIREEVQVGSPPFDIKGQALAIPVP